ncbi:hypothetical protein [Marinobacter sp. BGYM27]|uniref:hypothetical protein n=1 Tax=Marinobacter sp. BGYM27 TaxID=2975597 RepID=UPI0021A95803|nr:hypothetical protein [Marinobacter sp. BGYM27]MDG5500760.1 hypothetical protein [Marinobacter sp. BGYM27]
MSVIYETERWLELCDEANQAEARYVFERTFQNLRELRRVQKERDELAAKLGLLQA